MISHTSVTEQLVQYFKDNINSGNWKVGEKIPSEHQLTETLGVSRASVRTAIQHFVGIGVLESKHGKGTYLLDDRVDESTGSEMKITSEDCRDIQKVLEFRRIVESEACYLASQKKTSELIEELQNCLEEMKKMKGRREEFVTADIRFHETICRATQNPILEKSMLKVFEETRKRHHQMNEIFGYEDGIYYHTQILEAIRCGEAEHARKMMFDHLQHAINKLEKKQL